MHAAQLASRNGQVARCFRSAGQHDRVELRLQRFGGVYGQPVFGVFCRAHIGGWTELDAFCLHLRKTAVDMGLFQLEVGNAITQQAAEDRKSTRLNSSHKCASRMPTSDCKKKSPPHYTETLRH